MTVHHGEEETSRRIATIGATSQTRTEARKIATTMTMIDVERDPHEGETMMATLPIMALAIETSQETAAMTDEMIDDATIETAVGMIQTGTEIGTGVTATVTVIVIEVVTEMEGRRRGGLMSMTLANTPRRAKR